MKAERRRRAAPRPAPPSGGGAQRQGAHQSRRRAAPRPAPPSGGGAQRQGALRLSLVVQYACDADGLPPRARLRSWVRAALRAGAPVSAAITLRFVDEAEGCALNRDYRHRDYATNVLSFPYADAPDLAGDLVLCRTVLEREARAQRKTLADHCAHLVVHGVLHLLGFDHETGAADAEAMEAEERRILARLGIADPYGGVAEAG